eukprot:TRINITY_DN8454_c0_g1_i3.p1 TRINITY_DN8454_c0_g1~~TRINITY_DN8454_c0_g1_i3.p1  ORF type:complete len:685 (+),score=98.68 TRINITY_DN8454_c0_g1_i3:291-2057(+)
MGQRILQRNEELHSRIAELEQQLHKLEHEREVAHEDNRAAMGRAWRLAHENRQLQALHFSLQEQAAAALARLQQTEEEARDLQARLIVATANAALPAAGEAAAHTFQEQAELIDTLQQQLDNAKRQGEAQRSQIEVLLGPDTFADTQACFTRFPGSDGAMWRAEEPAMSLSRRDSADSQGSSATTSSSEVDEDGGHSGAMLPKRQHETVDRLFSIVLSFLVCEEESARQGVELEEELHRRKIVDTAILWEGRGIAVTATEEAEARTRVEILAAEQELFEQIYDRFTEDSLQLGQRQALQQLLRQPTTAISVQAVWEHQRGSYWFDRWQPLAINSGTENAFAVVERAVQQTGAVWVGGWTVDRQPPDVVDASGRPLGSDALGWQYSRKGEGSARRSAYRPQYQSHDTARRRQWVRLCRPPGTESPAKDERPLLEVSGGLLLGPKDVEGSVIVGCDFGVLEVVPKSHRLRVMPEDDEPLPAAAGPAVFLVKHKGEYVAFKHAAPRGQAARYACVDDDSHDEVVTCVGAHSTASSQVALVPEGNDPQAWAGRFLLRTRQHRRYWRGVGDGCVAVVAAPQCATVFWLMPAKI